MTESGLSINSRLQRLAAAGLQVVDKPSEIATDPVAAKVAELAAKKFRGGVAAATRAIGVAMSRIPEPEKEAVRSKSAAKSKRGTPFNLRLPYSAEKFLSKFGESLRMNEKQELVWKRAVVKKYGRIDLASQDVRVVQEVLRLRLAAVGHDPEKVAKVLAVFRYLRKIERAATEGWRANSKLDLNHVIDLFFAKKGREVKEAFKGDLLGLESALRARWDSDLLWVDRYVLHKAAEGRKPWLEANERFRRIYADQAVDAAKQLGGQVCFHSALEAHVFRLAYPQGSDKQLRTWLTRDRATKGQWDSRIQPFSALVIQDTIDYQARNRSNPDASRQLSAKAIDRYGLESQQFVMSVARAQTPERVFNWLQRTASGRSLILSWSGADGLGHAIQIDLSRGHYGLWDANRGRYSYGSDDKTFKQVVIAYLRAFGGSVGYRIDIPTISKR